MLLSEMQKGTSFRVVRVTSGREIARRLADMGFTEGAEGIVVRTGFLKGPMHVRIRGYGILIRRSEASDIEISPVEAAGIAT